MEKVKGYFICNTNFVKHWFFALEENFACEKFMTYQSSYFSIISFPATFFHFVLWRQCHQTKKEKTRVSELSTLHNVPLIIEFIIELCGYHVQEPEILVLSYSSLVHKRMFYI